jgi:hypothetical protein
VPGLGLNAAPAFADALAECTAIASLDLSLRTLPFRSWQQLGPTLHSLNLTDLGDGGTDTTFRLLADNMPALRELEFIILGQFSQDGFIELVSRLRSLTLNNGCPWASVTDPGAWPLTLPKLEELVWSGGDGVDTLAVAVVRRAVSLRAAHVSHASAVAAIAAGSVASVGDGDLGTCTPLANVRTLTLTGVANDVASFSKVMAASPRATTVRLRWTGSAPELPWLWDLFHAAASVFSGEDAAGWRRVRRVCLKMDYPAAPEPTEAARCVRALFPRARYASWSANGVPDVQILPPLN